LKISTGFQAQTRENPTVDGLDPLLSLRECERDKDLLTATLFFSLTPLAYSDI